MKRIAQASSTPMRSIHIQTDQPNHQVPCDVRGPKGPEWFGASLTKEDQMKLVSRFEAATRSTVQLHGLYRQMFNIAANAPQGSDTHRNASASLENIRVELAARAPLR